MQYLGGKSRTAEQIAEHMATLIRPGTTVWEPFCGGLSVAERLAPRVKNADARLVVSDLNEALIVCYLAVIERRWKPPNELSEKTYNELKTANDPRNPETAFAAAGCSFGGKWWGGYARCRRGYNYIAGAAASLMRKCDVLRACRVHVQHADFWSLRPVRRDTIYADPPYSDSVGYNAVEIFDHPVFWDRCLQWARKHEIGVRISEYTSGVAGETMARSDDWKPAIDFGEVQILGRSRGAEQVRSDVLWRAKGCL